MAKNKMHLPTEDNDELNLIAAEVNAKSKTSFLEDFFINAILLYQKGENLPTFPIFESDLSENSSQFALSLDVNTAYYLRLNAVKLGTNIKVYMQSFCIWLANEHRENGRVWIDDTPVKALPIRMRK
jgi:hypothetical protein